LPVPGSALDTARPNPSRVYDYLLGGRENYHADREQAALIEAAYPPPREGHLPVPREMAARNRAFLDRAVSWVARQGVRQFLDLGSGLPVRAPLRSVHEAAPDARVAYVDHDAEVVKLAGAQLDGLGRVSVIEGDLADPEAVLADPAVRSVIDMGQPVGLVAAMVLHLFEASEAADIMRRYVRALAPGSYLIVTVPRWEPPRDDPGLWERVRAACGPAGVRNHSWHEAGSFFAGTKLVPPGLTVARAWRPVRPEGLEPDAPAYVLAGLGRKP
jgi:SAM-dependent methyltransferase